MLQIQLQCNKKDLKFKFTPIGHGQLENFPSFCFLTLELISIKLRSRLWYLLIIITTINNTKQLITRFQWGEEQVGCNSIITTVVNI